MWGQRVTGERGAVLQVASWWLAECVPLQAGFGCGCLPAAPFDVEGWPRAYVYMCLLFFLRLAVLFSLQAE